MTLTRTRHTLILSVVLALAALAWAASLALPTTPLAGALVHQPTSGSSALTGLVLFLAAWVVMTAAMMLPTALPMVSTYAELARAGGRVALFVVGYLVAWTGFGLVAFAFDLVVHRAVRASPLLAEHTSLLGGGALVLAGVYQLTPLKRRCLRLCRSALSFLMSAWRDGRRGAWLMGVHHGVFCVGCCWALMLVMFALGMAQLAWMLGLTLLMFIEKTIWRGERLGQLASPVLALLGLATALGIGGVS